jgi:hypothetical protein
LKETDDPADIIKGIFEKTHGFELVSEHLELTPDFFDELMKIAHSIDNEYVPLYEIGEETFVELTFHDGTIYMGIAGDKTAYDYDEDEDEDVDCIGDFSIDLYTREVDFDVRCDT